VSEPKLLTIKGRTVEWVICSKHEQYRDSGVMVLSCRKCVIRRIEDDSND